MSGRQIERFFRVNPDLADDYAGDDFWERRAIAARYLSQKRLLTMLDDPDEVVRRALAYRLPVEALDALVADPDREVRITVADRLPAEKLEQMADDPDYLVRHYVAKRLPAGRLFRLIVDEDREVRKTVAKRLPPESLEPYRLTAAPIKRRQYRILGVTPGEKTYYQVRSRRDYEGVTEISMEGPEIDTAMIRPRQHRTTVERTSQSRSRSGANIASESPPARLAVRALRPVIYCLPDLEKQQAGQRQQGCADPDAHDQPGLRHAAKLKVMV